MSLLMAHPGACVRFRRRAMRIPSFQSTQIGFRLGRQGNWLLNGEDPLYRAKLDFCWKSRNDLAIHWFLHAKGALGYSMLHAEEPLSAYGFIY